MKDPERIACLYIESLPVAALVRLSPDLAGEALAVYRGRGGQAQVVAVTARAARAGVVPGMTVAQARSLAGDCLLRAHSPAAVRSALADLVEVAHSFSPRVTASPEGLVYLGLRGLAGLHPDERRLARKLQKAAARAGIQVRVGIASGLLASRLAARTAGEAGVRVLAAERQAQALAELPMSLLDGSTGVLELCRAMGLERLGQLAALDPAEVMLRLGPPGLRLWRQARGQDLQPPSWHRFDERLLERADCEHPLSRLEPLLLVINRLGRRLARRLQGRGLVAAELYLDLRLESGGRTEHRLRPASPCACWRTWLELARARLQQQPPPLPVAAVGLAAEVMAQVPGQLELFGAGGAAAADFAGLAARLAARLGAERVGCPLPADTHMPGRFELVAFPPSRRAGSAGGARPAGCGWPPLRALRPPRPVQVECGPDGRPRRISAGHWQGVIRRQGGPWRVKERWWSEPECELDYYEVELAGGPLLRLCHRRPADLWLADGVFG